MWNGGARIEYPPNARIEDVYAANRAYFGVRGRSRSPGPYGHAPSSSPSSPVYNPTSGPNSPAYHPTSPDYNNPPLTPHIAPNSPAYNPTSPPYNPTSPLVYRLEDQAFRRIGLDPSTNAWIIDDEYDSIEHRKEVRVNNVYNTDASHTVPLGDLSAKMYIYKDDTDSLFFRWNLCLNHMGAPVIQNTETNKTIHLPHLLCYETSCTYAYKNSDHQMIPCQITEFNEEGDVYVVLLTADKSKRMKRGQFRLISAYDLIKLAGSVYDNDGRKQYIVDTSHRSSLLPYDEATVIDADGGDLHTQDREDASTTGESSETESESESDSENESESETHNRAMKIQRRF